MSTINRRNANKKVDFNYTRNYATYEAADKAANKAIDNLANQIHPADLEHYSKGGIIYLITSHEGRFVPVMLLRQEQFTLMHCFITGTGKGFKTIVQ